MTASPRERENTAETAYFRSYGGNGDTDTSSRGRDHSRSSSAPVETTCQQCGEQVSRQFVRVFAEEDAEGVFGCQACYSISAITRGAARPDHDGTERERRTAAKRGETGGRR
jgi:hypothetical protein